MVTLIPDEVLPLLCSIWPWLSNATLKYASEHYVAFSELIHLQLLKLKNDPDVCSLSSLSQISQVINEYQGDQGLTRQEAARAIKRIDSNRYANYSEETLWRTVEVVISIWLTIDVRLVKDRARGPYGSIPLDQNNFILWIDNSPLDEAIAEYFERQSLQRPVKQRIIFEADWTLSRLINLHGFSVHWCHNLADHLLVDFTLKQITVYEHKICLTNHLITPSSAIPVVVLEEAIDTLNLLLPFEDKATKSLLQRERKQFYGLGRCSRDRVLELDRYLYWGSRLENLIEIFKEPPRGLQQLKPDRSRPDLKQSLNFWIAAAVAFLTVMSFTFGVISTVYAKKQYEAGILQYRLALSQACALPNASVQLPEFCS